MRALHLCQHHGHEHERRLHRLGSTCAPQANVRTGLPGAPSHQEHMRPASTGSSGARMHPPWLGLAVHPQLGIRLTGPLAWARAGARGSSMGSASRASLHQHHPLRVHRLAGPFPHTAAPCLAFSLPWPLSIPLVAAGREAAGGCARGPPQQLEACTAQGLKAQPVPSCLDECLGWKGGARAVQGGMVSG